MSDRYRQHHPAAEVISEAERIIRDAEAGMTKPPEPDWFFLLFLVHRSCSRSPLWFFRWPSIYGWS